MNGNGGSAATDVVIVGGGLAGLACAARLQAEGLSFLLLEAANRPGGRVRTDAVDGFLLDRGFQVLLTAYPEARSVLDFDALDLHHFRPGALVHHDGDFQRLSDPFRRPGDMLETLQSSVGTLTDKLRVARLRRRVRRGDLEELFSRPETTTEERLRLEGFSSKFIETFFRPFLAGIFLERDLRTSSRMFEYVFRMFALGAAALPAAGMEAIPRQLAERLPADRIRVAVRVTSVREGRVMTLAGEEVRAAAVVLACEGPAAARLVPDLAAGGSRSTTTLYYASEDSPIDEPTLVLNGEADGPVNNLCVPSDVCPAYAPAGASLISVSVVGDVARDRGDALEEAVRRQLRDWFGPAVSRWRHLRTYRIDHALPDQSPPLDAGTYDAARLQRGLYACGDYRTTGSIDGALRSGRAAADTVIRDLIGDLETRPAPARAAGAEQGD